MLDWEEYGLKIQVPEGATSDPCDIAIKAIVAGQFEFPEGTDLVSAVYAISVSKRLTKPVMLEIQHCVAITREEQGRFLSFVRAQCNQPQLYHISLSHWIMAHSLLTLIMERLLVIDSHLLQQYEEFNKVLELVR